MADRATEIIREIVQYAFDDDVIFLICELWPGRFKYDRIYILNEILFCLHWLNSAEQKMYVVGII